MINTRAAYCLLLVSLLTIGCKSLRKSGETDLVEPLSVETPHRQSLTNELPSERVLCIETANTVSQKGHVVEAIKLYERAEQLDPSAAPLDQQLAPLYSQVGNHSDAIKRYRRLSLESPNDLELNNNYAWTLMEAKRCDAALAEVQRGLNIDEDHERLRSTLAMIYYRQGDRVNALKQFTRLQGFTAAQHNLALLELDAGNVESAIKHLREAIENPTDQNSTAKQKCQQLLAVLTRARDSENSTSTQK